MPESNNPTTLQSNSRAAVKVTLIGSALDLLLAALKIIIGITSNSVALISDGIHSFSDLVTDAFVILLARISHQEPDAEHPYGHRRFETMGTVVISIGLFIVAGIICFDSTLRLLRAQQLPTPGWPALVVTLVSIASKEWIYRYTRDVGERIGSSMLLANAWHSRTDALSSVVVLIGIVGVWMGAYWMDIAAALFVGLLIARIAWKLLSRSLAELVDTALPRKEMDAIKRSILNMTDVRGVHDMRSRLHGEKAFLDIHVQVNSRISVSEGHYLGDRLCLALKKEFPRLTDIVVHIDPELDEDIRPTLLPGRQEIEQALKDVWSGLLLPEQIEGFVLHYLNGQVEVEVKIDISILNIELRDKLKVISNDMPYLKSLKVTGVYL